jgi:hypothetical protein
VTLSVKTWAVSLVRDELAKKFLWFVIAGVLTLAVIFRDSWASKMSTLEWVLIGTIALLLITFLVRHIVRRRSYRHAWYPRNHPRYEVIREEINYIVDSDGVLTYSRRFRLKAMMHDVDDFIDQFVWTAGGAGTPMPGTGVSRIEPRLQAGIWTYYTARFPRHLRKGQEHEFEVVWPPLRNWKDASPFVSASTDLPTRELVFNVQLPSDSIREGAFGEEMRSIESAFPFHTEELSFERGRLVWTPNPKLYRHYRLRWSWAEGARLERLSQPSSGGSST